MTSGVNCNRYAHCTQIRMRTLILKNFCEFGFSTQRYTFVQKISAKYDFWGEL